MKSVDIDSLRMKFSGLRYDTLWFTSGPQKLDPGETVIDLFCPVSWLADQSGKV